MKLIHGKIQGPPSTWDPPGPISGTHTIPILPGIRTWEWYGSSMGMGIPLLGVPGISLDLLLDFFPSYVVMLFRFLGEKIMVELVSPFFFSTSVKMFVLL